jgi:molybdopterin molybdotransferase
VVPTAVPPEPVALRAGFAVSSQDLVGVSAYAPVLLSNAPSRVAAGDRLPPGCDAVLPPDAVITTGTMVEIVASAAPGENVRRAGEDVQPGQVLRRKGEVLRPVDGAVAAAAGLRRAIVQGVSLLVLSSDDNDEILQWVAAAPGGGTQTRSVAVPAGSKPDWEKALTSSNGDLILVIAPALPALPDARLAAARMIAEGLALSGAETAVVALLGQRPTILAPPRLDALLALSLCVVRPIIDYLTERQARPVWRRAPLSRKLSSSIGLTEVALVRETKGALEPVAVGSIPLGAVTTAEGYLVIPPESEGLQEGEVVEAYDL